VPWKTEAFTRNIFDALGWISINLRIMSPGQAFQESDPLVEQ
jgi:hypothetical protein